jgi:hypothetical protein
VYQNSWSLPTLDEMKSSTDEIVRNLTAIEEAKEE